VDRVHEANDVVLAFGFLQFFVLGEMRFLRLGVGLARDQLGLFNVKEPDVGTSGILA
jgi:hypothetical protein